MTTYDDALKEALYQASGLGISQDQIDPNYVKAIQEGTVGQYSDGAIQQGKTEQPDTYKSRSTSSSSGYGGSPNSLIDSAYRNSLTAQERQLKSALDEALSNYERQATETQRAYGDARSDAYSGQMVANRNTNEAMLAQGINSGAIAQAALSSGNALQRNLGGLSQEEASMLSDIERRKGLAQSGYQDDLVSLRASLEADKMNALLNDYYNQQSFNYQAQRDSVADSRYQDETAYGREYQATQDKKDWAYNMWQLLGYATQEIADTLNVAKGTPFERAREVSTYAGGGGAKPNLTAAQTLTALKDGIRSEAVLSAYEYYYGEPYSGGQNDSGFDGTVENPISYKNANISLSGRGDELEQYEANKSANISRERETIAYLETLSPNKAYEELKRDPEGYKEYVGEEAYNRLYQEYLSKIRIR